MLMSGMPLDQVYKIHAALDESRLALLDTTSRIEAEGSAKQKDTLEATFANIITLEQMLDTINETYGCSQMLSYCAGEHDRCWFRD